MKALAVGAHPDDVEFMCAGTLLLLRDAGFDVDIVTFTAGDCGSMEAPPERIARVRRGEAERAAALLGATYGCLGELDCRIFLDASLLAKTVEQVRRSRPDVVFTHFPRDYMVDHEEASRTVRSALFSAPMPNFRTGAEDPAAPLPRVPHLYYWAPMEMKDIFGRPVGAGFYVDISPVLERKVQMLACHRSQRDWLREQHGVDEYIEAMIAAARKAGAAAGASNAEGFTQHRGHGYPQDNLLADYLSVLEP